MPPGRAAVRRAAARRQAQLLQQHRVSGVQDVFYLRDYLCAAEEHSLASAIRASKQRWTQARRLVERRSSKPWAIACRRSHSAQARRCQAGACRALEARCMRRAAR